MEKIINKLVGFQQETVENINWKKIWAELKWMYGFGKPYRKRITFLIILSCFFTLLGVAYAYVYKELVDLVTSQYQTILSFITEHVEQLKYSSLWDKINVLVGMLPPWTVWVIVGYIVYKIIAYAYSLFMKFFTLKLSMDLSQGIQRQVYATVLESDWLSLTEYQAGDLVNRVTSDSGTISSFTLDTVPSMIVQLVQFVAAFALLVYLEQTQKRRPEHLMPFQPLDLGRHMLVDDVTERNLEIFQRLNGRKGKGTLRHVLDDTMTPMGGRLLEDMLRHPWREAAPILAVQDAVALLHDDDNRRALLREALKDVYDLERLSTRVTVNRATPRDFIALGNSLAALPAVLAALTQPLDGKYPLPGQENGEDAPRVIHELLKGWDDLADCAHLLRSALVDSPPVVITDGGLFKAGYNAELDRLLDLVEHGEQKLQEELAREQQETGIAKLKLGFNRVFGYYYELSKAAHSGPVPEHFIRRQTLANAERFTTPALKELEEALLSASEKRKTLEYQLYQDLRTFMAQQRERILHMADVIAHLDYWQSLAEVGRRNGWCRPELDGSADIFIEEGRHPVVEAMIGAANFVPNNITLDARRRLCLLTGPNMAGKSTVLRQVAIICLLAQTGSMVPATRARLGLVDRLFSRVGASDNLAQGQSTFMVEMMETARILRQATKRSLVILDEIGRGTSTYDGVALAWAVVEDLAARAHGEVRTLFATHYHELTALEKRVPGVFTMNIAIREYGGDILFLHKLVPGPADRSYGVEVARLAGVPAPVVQRARAILAELEQSRGEGKRMSPQTETLALPGMEKRVAREEPPSLPIDIPAAPAAGPHPLVLLLRDLDPEELSPLAALKLIMEWKKLWADAPDTEEKHV